MDPTEFAQLDAQAHANYDQSHPAATKQPKAKGNFLTHLLPTVGGTGGAIGGAAIGTAIAPGVGTLLGALLGGAVGGGASKVGENAIEHQNLTSGVAGQALEQGVLGAGPLRLAKAATFGTKAAVGAAKAGQGLEGAIAAAGEQTAAKSNIAKNLVTQGQQAQARTLGINAGQVVKGRELTPQDSATFLKTLDKHGITSDNANNALQALVEKQKAFGAQLSSHITANNTPFSKQEINQLAKEYLGGVGIGGQKTTDPAVLNEAKTIAKDFKTNVTDTKSLHDFRKSMDARLTDAKQASDASLPAKSAAIKSMRQFAADKLGNVPGMKEYSNLAEIRPFISAEARRANNPSGGVIGRIASSGPLQKAEATFGKGLEKLGTAAGGTGEIPSATSGLTPGAIAKRTVPLGIAQAGVQSAAQNTNMPQQGTDATSGGTAGPTDLTSALMAAQGGQSQSANPYSQDNLMADIQRDPKHATEYLDTYKNLDAIFNPAASTKNMIKPTGQQFGLAQGGLNALNQLSGLLQQNPALAAKNQTPGQGLPLVGNLITNAAGVGDYHALADNILQSLIHLQTGATATPEEVKAARGQLPGPGDPPEVVQRKLSNLSSMFSPYIQGGQLGQTSSNPQDLISALMQSGYGQ